MGRAKEHMMELENDRMRQWMMDTYGINEDELEEDSEEWQDIAQEYQNMLDGEQADEEAAAAAAAAAEAYDDDQEYMRQHPYDQMYQEYRSQQLLIQKIIKDYENSFEAHTIQKMAFVHSVTLMEALIGDMIKTLAIKHSYIMKKLSLCVEDEKSKKKFLIQEIIKQPGGVDGLVLEIFSKVSFHNLDSIKRILEGIFPETMKDLDYTPVRPVIERRHDFVHRNGKNTKGEYVEMSVGILKKDMDIIHSFSYQVYERINKAMNSPAVN
ncbi:hypothetical protein ALP05_01404 [Pseudomonas caricapapayae]|uniref:RiboL-PSP-HEPN domain-containing protein n=1 Tax=Pseudomonas caricapapayae TaxID=46678 RepID=A0A3M6F1X4_9PSED|nr:hypothetical protein [Pseudomonas caricapapayae]RMV74542.1 hypothetical protein ALP05_01404 [Pseudomonas caricapapayae]